MAVQKAPVCIIEYKYFDLLENPIEISLYTYIERTHSRSEVLDTELVERFFEKMGISAASLEEAYNKLHKIGYLIKGI